MNVVVAGAGIAGLTAALRAHEDGHRVALVVKDALGGGCTPLAQGGVAGIYGPGDSAALHAEDTLAAGGGLSDPAAVDVLVAEGSARNAELIARGVAFDRDGDGMLSLGREAAHRRARIAHVGGDATGAAISAALVDRVRETPIDVIEHAMLIDLLHDDGRVHGIRMQRGDAAIDLHADAVILATGGAGRLYAHTTNPAGATGDGIAAALRAGAAVADLEFMQFHPTVLAGGDAFLVSEAVRGDGAVLIDAEGRRFLLDEHPDAELAPRDVVARAVARTAGAQGSPVRLDATGIGAARLAARFPTIDRALRARGYDWALEAVPVTPAAHYLMGGVVTDIDGRTSLAGLFAAGEVARTGVHGANRLASNSLLEAAVFAARAVAALSSPGAAAFPSRFPSPAAATGDENRDGNGSREQLATLMWEQVGLLRTPDGLRSALDVVRSWRASAVAPRTRREHETANMLLVAEATVSAALARPASVGAHHIEPALIGAR